MLDNGGLAPSAQSARTKISPQADIIIGISTLLPLELGTIGPEDSGQGWRGKRTAPGTGGGWGRLRMGV